MFIEVIPPTVARTLTPSIPAGGLLTIVAEMRPVGMGAGDDQIVGGPIQFPIDLCNGCLKSPAACLLPKGTSPVVDPCFVQQDEQGTCCTNASGAYICGMAAISTM
jgi:hypothetical protein